jgi:hypothetical protein
MHSASRLFLTSGWLVAGSPVTFQQNLASMAEADCMQRRVFRAPEVMAAAE